MLVLMLLAGAPLLGALAGQWGLGWRTVRASAIGAGLGTVAITLLIPALSSLPVPEGWTQSFLRGIDDYSAAGMFQFRSRIDSIALLMIGTLGLCTAGLSVKAYPGERFSHSEDTEATAGESWIACGLLTVAVWFWLVETVSLALVLQSVLLALAFLMLAWNTSAGATARSFWIGITISDVALLLAALIWNIEADAMTFQQAAAPAAIQAVTDRAVALASLVGSLLWLGILARLLQIPWGLLCDVLSKLSGFRAGTTVLLALAGVAWKWALVAGPWWASSPSSIDFVSSTAAVLGAVAAWFAICPGSPLVRSGWLLAWAWSTPCMLLLSSHANPLTATGVMLVTLLAGSALLSQFRAPSADPNPDGDELPGGGLLSGNWFRGLTVHWQSGRWQSAGSQTETTAGSTFEFSATQTETRRSTMPHVADVWPDRRGFLCALLALLWAPALLGHRADLTETGWTWPDAVRLFSTCLAGWTAMNLIHATPRAETIRPSGSWRWQLMVFLISGGALLLPGMADVLSELQTTAALAGLLALATGIVAGLLTGRRPTESVILSPWKRLGQRRLHLSLLLRLGLSWPLRAIAQFVRFCDSVLWQKLILGGLARLPRAGMDADVELTQTQADFYLLSFSVLSGVVLMTLLWFG